MKKFKIYMSVGGRKPVMIDSCRSLQQAQTRVERFIREDNYERSIGYHVNECEYTIKEGK